MPTLTLPDLPNLPEGYTLTPGTPDPTSYITLRLQAGLAPPTEAQALAGNAGAWCAYHAVHDATSTAVSMGRVISDGGLHFYIIDMTTLPNHQRKGLGKIILAALLEKIKTNAPPGAWVKLLADPPGRPLYRKFGFEETGEEMIAMHLRVD